MSEIAIRCRELSKQYRIGEARARYSTLREALTGTVLAPLKHRNGKSAHDLIWALKDVSFEVEQGEIVGIIGRNGAGKSTLLKVLSRITRPTTGWVELHGRVGSLLEVGTGFHPELTGRENIFLNGAILGMKKAEIVRNFDEIVAFAEVEKFIDTPVKRYSSGMYLRLAFAVASHMEPEMLLVDEVLAVGDAAFQEKCLGRMGNVAKEGRTVLFVSHNMTAVKTLCSRVICLDKGKIIADGDPGQVASGYLQKGRFSVAEQLWNDPVTAPGNEKVKIRSARVLTSNQVSAGEITVESPIQLEFEFWNQQAGAILNFTMHLLNIDGTYVFAAGSEAMPRPQGLLKETAKIPANLLNDGIYTVTIQVVQDTTMTLYLHPEVLVFEVLEGVRRGRWFGKWPGVIRPSLEWSSQTIIEDKALHE